MKINFKKVTIKNFLSFGNVPTTFDYTSGINIVTGQNLDNGTRNGVGKSSGLVDSIAFALYGKTLRGKKINKDEIVNDINKKGCEVTVEFSIGADNYKVIRTAKPSSFVVYVNDEEYKQDSIKKTEEWFIQRIGVNYTSFKNIIVINLNDSTPFLNMESAEKREVIENILNMGVYFQLSELAKNKHLISKNEMKVLEIKYKQLNDTLNIAKSSYENIKAQEEQFNKNKQISIDKLNNQINDISNEINKLKESISNIDFDKEIRLKEEAVQKAKSIIIECNSNINLAKKELKDANSVLSILEHAPYCPTCKTPTDNPLIKQYIQETTEKIKISNEQISSNTERYNKALSVDTLFTEKIKQIRVDKEVNNNKIKKINELQISLSHSKEQLTNIESSKFYVTNVITKEQIDEYTKNNEITENELKAYEKEFNFSQALKKILGEEGVRKFVISKILPFLNNKVNSYLKILGSDLTIKFDSELNESIITRVREERTYGSFSGGEKKRIDLSILMSLMDLSKLQNSVDTNLLILDEALDTAMDNEGVDNFLNHLKNGFKNIYPDKCVYIITHRNTISDDFYNKMIIMELKDGFTTIKNIVDMQKS